MRSGEVKPIKQEAVNKILALQPVPKTIVSVRDKDGRDNALVVGFAANVSLDPPMVMIGIVPTRFSHHMVKQNPYFVINIPGKNYEAEYNYLGTHSGCCEDKIEEMAIHTENGTYINAPILIDCLVNIECSVSESTKPGSHELIIGKVEAVHVDERYLDEKGNILWDQMELL